MKVLLASRGRAHGSFTRRLDADKMGLMDSSLMPPVQMRVANGQFVPDYSSLLLASTVVMDEASYERLDTKPPRYYEDVATTCRELRRLGFLETVDFPRALRQHQSLLDRMLEHDTEYADQWIDPLAQAQEIHYEMYRRSNGLGGGGFAGSEQLDAGLLVQVHEVMARLMTDVGLVRQGLAQDECPYREGFWHLLRSYLLEVNAMIVLSNWLGTGFHDWQYCLPFYEHKFLSVGRDNIESEAAISATQKLFDLSFPEFAIGDTASLVRALEDRRIEELRRLVADAVEGRVGFDEEFARRTLMEVLRVEQGVSRYRRIVSYLTAPLGFIPWIGTPLQKAAEEGLVHRRESKLKEPHQWFYMLSDIADERERNGAGCDEA